MNNRLIVIAHPDEAEAFEKANVDVLVTGFGKVNATLKLAKALANEKYDEVVVFGTVGRVKNSTPTEELLEVIAAVQHDAQFQKDFIYSKLNPVAYPVFVATGDYFVEDKNNLPLDIDVVDMESYSYLKVGEEFDVPVRILKLVSDNAEEGSVEDWDVKVSELSKKLYKYYSEIYV